jgi:hypothetical protein
MVSGIPVVVDMGIAMGFLIGGKSDLMCGFEPRAGHETLGAITCVLVHSGGAEVFTA